MMLPLFLAGAAAWAACDETTRTSDLAVHALNVDLAWMQLDRAKVEEHATQLEVVLPCLEEALAPNDAAAYFRAHAMRSFLSRDLEVAKLDLRALRDIQPSYGFPTALVQSDHPLRALFSEVEDRQGAPTRSLPEPAGGWLQIDGELSAEAPTDRPYTLQHIRNDGVVVTTQRVDLNEVPLYRTAIEARTQRTARRRKTRLVAGAITASAAGALWATAAVGRVAYDQGDGQSTALFVLTDTAWVGSVAAGSAGTGLLVWGFTTR